MRRWTEEEEALMLSLRRAGFSTDEIASQLDRTWAAVDKRLGQFTKVKVSNTTHAPRLLGIPQALMSRSRMDAMYEGCWYGGV